MPDTPFMIGANGMIADVSFNGLPAGYATVGQQPAIGTGETPNLADTPSPGPWSVSQLLPGALVQLRGGGEVDLSTGSQSPMLAIGSGSNPTLGGTAGSLQLDLVTGAAGSATPVVYLSSQVGLVTVPTLYIGVFLDSTNRPTFTITDAFGAIKAQGSPSGSAIPAGVVLQLRLFWDSTGNVLPGYVSFYINGVPQALGTISGPWTAFQCLAVYYGRGAKVGGGNPFTGVLNKLQASNSAQPTNSQIVPATARP
jgi:hypothetical protein